MPPLPDSLLLRQGRHYLIVGAVQLLLDWLVFVALSWLGLPVATANISGRIAGALLGFWLNGRLTFADNGRARLGWSRLVRFIGVWSLLTLASTLLVDLAARHFGLELAWLAKPTVEGALAVAGFFLWRHVVYR